MLVTYFIVFSISFVIEKFFSGTNLYGGWKVRTGLKVRMSICNFSGSSGDNFVNVSCGILTPSLGMLLLAAAVFEEV